MFLFQMISVLLISIIFYAYLGNIAVSCDLGFKDGILNKSSSCSWILWSICSKMIIKDPTTP